MLFVTFFVLRWEVPHPPVSKMADIVTLLSNNNLKYTREVLLQLSSVAKRLPCPSLEDWVPQNSPCPTQCRECTASRCRPLQARCWSRDINKRQRKRGKRGGVRIRMRKTRNTVPLPTITFANVRSFGRSKGNQQLDSLHANVKFPEEYRNSCILCFTETWWGEETPVENTRLEGLGFPYRLDRDRDITGKKNGGGVCIYVNERWCKKNAVIVRETHNTGGCGKPNIVI